jgi:haloalkane dehalogenase
VERAETLDVGRLVAAGCARGLAASAQAAYDAPFPDEAHKAGPRAMPLLVPTRPDDPESGPNRAAWAALADYARPFVVAFSDSDPITGAMGPVLRGHVRGAGAGGGEDPGHTVLHRAGHFLQEDAGAELASVVAGVVHRITH